MPQTGLKSRPSSLPRGNLERAIRAAHDDFERALVSEWDAGSDSAHIRNAMTPLRYRCRHCLKPATGLGNLCVCRATKDWERCVSNPRNALHGLLQQRCRGIVDSASLGRFVRNLVDIAAANNFETNWIECRIDGLFPSLKGVCRKWVIGICPAPFAQTGILPAWFKDEREVIPDSDLQLGLGVNETEAELIAIEAEIEQYFEEATKSALDKASLQLAARSGPKRSQRKRERQDLIAGMVATTKRGNPDASIEQICKILDMKKSPLREIDGRAGFSTWHDAWADLNHRPRIKRFISGILPAAPKRKI